MTAVLNTKQAWKCYCKFNLNAEKVLWMRMRRFVGCTYFMVARNFAQRLQSMGIENPLKQAAAHDAKVLLTASA